MLATPSVSTRVDTRPHTRVPPHYSACVCTFVCVCVCVYVCMSARLQEATIPTVIQIPVHHCIFTSREADVFCTQARKPASLLCPIAEGKSDTSQEFESLRGRECSTLLLSRRTRQSKLSFPGHTTMLWILQVSNNYVSNGCFEPWTSWNYHLPVHIVCHPSSHCF